MHIGTLRTALYDVLFARQQKGVFILRIEDTDQKREVEGALENLLRTLAAVGMIPDEGPILESGKIIERGSHGPYVQSARLHLYKKYAGELLASGHAYRCVCTQERLEQLRKEQTAMKQAPRYDGACREINATGDSFVLRLKVPHDGATTFTDLVHGTITVANKEIDDQVLMKSDGFPTYHLANVVDDHLMEITHVIRGDEWLPSTPKHVLLYRAFGWEPPQFAHLPLILNPDKSKLSKRQGDVAVEDFLKQGYLPEALINFVALLGWNPGTEQEIFSFDELVQAFSFERVGKSGAVFNREKLDWMNGMYIRKLSSAAFRQQAESFLTAARYTGEDAFVEAALATVQERVKRFDELPALTHFYFTDPTVDPAMLVWKKSDAAGAREHLAWLIEWYKAFTGAWDATTLERETMVAMKAADKKTGDTLWPMRVALSGEKNSPGPFLIASVLGKEKTLARLSHAHQMLA